MQSEDQNPRKRSAPTAPPTEGKKGRQTVVFSVAAPDVKNIKAYASVAADPEIILPEVTILKATSEPATTYPPLIVDGASGVGKTQQFFLLLRDGYSGAYVLPRIMTGKPQEIYQEMESFTGMGKLRRVLKEESFAALQKETENNQAFPDPFSIATIRHFIKHSDIFDTAISALESAIFEYAESESGLAPLIKVETDKYFLRGKVLFIDEVLSGSSLEDSKFLRFLRNLGRELGMRCVLAGTSATAANMICETHQSEGGSSRSSEESDVVWAVVCFLWKKSKAEESGNQEEETKEPEAGKEEEETKEADNDEETEETPQQSLLKCLGDGRPLIEKIVKRYLDSPKTRKNKQITKKLIEHVGNVIVDTKNPSKAASLSWAMGIWLDGEEKSHHPFRMKSASLVKNHFFEPAIRVVKEGSDDEDDSDKPAGSAAAGHGSAAVAGDGSSAAVGGNGSSAAVGGNGSSAAVGAAVGGDGSSAAVGGGGSSTAAGGDGSEKGADKNRKAFTGWGLGTLERQSSPLYINVMRAQARPLEKPWWFISITDKPVSTIPLEDDQEVATCRNFRGVEYALSACVQQCLVREPVLAVSLMKTLSGLHNASDSFIEVVSESLREERYSTSSSQGGLNERLCMAALVVVSAKLGFDEAILGTNAEQFTNALIGIMNQDYAQAPREAFREISGKGPNHKTGKKVIPKFYVCHQTKEAPPKKDDKKLPEKDDTKKNKKPAVNLPPGCVRLAEKDENNQKPALYLRKAAGIEERSLATAFAATDMPLLVPACSKAGLAKTAALYPGLFEGLQVAGLVPGSANSRLDLSAHMFSNAEPAAWMFELRSRSHKYSVSQAARDLTEKVRGSKESCHAMLICLKGEGPSDCWVWKDEKENLNVAMVLAFSAY